MSGEKVFAVARDSPSLPSGSHGPATVHGSDVAAPGGPSVGAADGLPADASHLERKLRAPELGPRQVSLDHDHDAPAGAQLRRYDPTLGSPYWKGVLPGNSVDPDTRNHTKSCRWGLYAGRTEPEAFDEVKDWLWRCCS